MIRRTLYVSLAILCFSVAILKGQINHRVTFSSDYSIVEKKLDDGNIYNRIIFPESQTTDSVGYPKLPVKYINLIIPAGSIATGITINEQSSEKLKLEKLIEPFQPPVPTVINYQVSDFVKPKSSVYESDNFFPSSIAKIIHQGSFRGNSIVTLAVFPFQYDPIRNELLYFSGFNISLELITSKVDKAGEQKSIKKFEGYNKILESIVDNKADVNKYNVTSSIETLEDKPVTIEDVSSTLKTSGELTPVSCDYVIVTSSALAPEFFDFIAWKKRKGINTELVTIESIKSSYAGDNISGINDDAGKLRQFLSDSYDNGLIYALLAGDHDIVPIRYGWASDNYDDSEYIIPADLYFSDFDGDWEVDGDGRYGEPYNDNVDYNPEIYVGRLLCSTANEVQNWIGKVLKYEQNPGNGDYSYLKKAFYTQADHLQQQDQARYIANKFNPVFNTKTIWEEIYNGVPDYESEGIPEFPKGSDVINEMNNKYGLVSWFGHGGPSGICMASKGNNEYGYRFKYNMFSMDSWDEDPSHVYSIIPESSNGLDNLTSYNYPSIAYTIACTVTPFDAPNPASAPTNVGEGFTVLTKAGGPAFLGNTRYGWVSSSYLLFEKFIDVIITGSSYNIGIAEATSKQNYNSHYLRYTHNLIGCPETEMWTNLPSAFTNVNVSRSGSDVIVSTGVTGSRICVMSALDNGDSYYHVVNNVGTHAFINVPEPYLVTITKHNYIPYLKNPDNIYIQNESIYSQKYIYGEFFYAGTNVTTQKPQGPAIIKNGSNVIFNAEYDVNLEGGFEVEYGASFEIK